MKYVSLQLAASLLLALTLTTGCSRATPAPETPLRAVKVETVRSVSDSELPVIGLVREEQRADLGFETSGRVAAVVVDIGDAVRRGQTLARLDSEPMQLKLQQARADVGAAKAQLTERETTYRQQQVLFDDRVISPAALAAARAGYLSSEEQLAGARAAEALAARAFRNSAIVAPFDGRIVGRNAQPFADVAAGQSVLRIESEGRVEVVGTLPAVLAEDLKPGTIAVAHPSDESSQAISVRLEKISSRTENGALVEAIFRATEAGTVLRSGETVLLTLPMTRPELPSVPVTALLPAAPGQPARVFVYDTHTGKVVSRRVVPETVSDGHVLLREGVSPGEAVVATGAQFLIDGQAVRLFQPETQFGRESTL
ncbi:MAG: efflux RND transporter periplasmic adaptor subunit [Paraburkholderia sp.]|uniref:efflux RND transporter periplasmic adaptor subunit n=1 Tax=Paraburkholderia sp. TaxID=1926495 RepID=UPI003978A7A8